MKKQPKLKEKYEVRRVVMTPSERVISCVSTVVIPVLIVVYFIL
jgi:hypothetical protein